MSISSILQACAPVLGPFAGIAAQIADTIAPAGNSEAGGISNADNENNRSMKTSAQSTNEAEPFIKF